MTDRFHATPEDVERSGIADDPLVWFVLQTNPNCELKALEGLLERGFIAYCPLEVRWHRPTRRGKADAQRIAKARPLLRGYIFLGMCAMQSFYRVRQTDGVKDVVRMDGRPMRIPERDIMWFKDREDRGVFDQTRPTEARYHKGDRVKVTTGAFSGQVGEVLEEMEDGKLKLMLEGLFRKGVPVDDDHVEAMAA